MDDDDDDDNGDGDERTGGISSDRFPVSGGNGGLKLGTRFVHLSACNRVARNDPSLRQRQPRGCKLKCSDEPFFVTTGFHPARRQHRSFSPTQQFCDDLIRSRRAIQALNDGRQPESEKPLANRVAKIIGCRAREVSGSVAEGVLTVDVVLIVDADSRAPQLDEANFREHDRTSKLFRKAMSTTTVGYALFCSCLLLGRPQEATRLSLRRHRKRVWETRRVFLV